MLPFDLHVLSMPPAFNLSQDQTLQFNTFAHQSILTCFLLLFGNVNISFFSCRLSIYQGAHTVCLLVFLMILPRRRAAYSTLSQLLVKRFFHYFSLKRQLTLYRLNLRARLRKFRLRIGSVGMSR